MASSGAPDSEASLELCAKLLDQCYRSDRTFLDLNDHLLKRAQAGGAEGLSGLGEADYATLEGLGLGAATELVPAPPRPLPPELVDQFAHMQCNCAMGLFPSIGRAWVGIDSDLYVWNYESGGDLAYYDGLDTVILHAALAKPKAGVFNAAVRRLLVLATPTELVLLALYFKDGDGELVDSPSGFRAAELHVDPVPVFRLSLDGAVVTGLAATESGRVFFGATDGCLYELQYRDGGWLRGPSCAKQNHSKGLMSLFVPSFAAAVFGKDQPLAQLLLDASRHCLFTLSESGDLQAFDLGADGTALAHVAGLSGEQIRGYAARLAPTIDPDNFGPIVHASVLGSEESQDLSLIGITAAGVRLIFSAYHPRPLAHQTGSDAWQPSRAPQAQAAIRPTCLRLAHVRLPPGFTPSLHVTRPRNVHLGLLKRDFSIFLTADQKEVDGLWFQSTANFPFYPGIVETHSQVKLRGRTWCMVEDVTVSSEEPTALQAWVQRNPSLTPPLLPAVVVRQHRLDPVVVTVLSAQGIQRLELLRPVDVLRRLLLESGAESGPVGRFFAVHGAEGAGAMCLLLAASTAIQDRLGVAEAALRAFFLHAGEPSLLTAPPSAGLDDRELASRLAASKFSNHSVFGGADFTTIPGSPQLASTPVQSPTGSGTGMFQASAIHAPQELIRFDGAGDRSGLNSSMMKASGEGAAASPTDHLDVAFSAAHNALHLHFSRILGTLWEMRLTVADPKAKGSRDPPLHSAFSCEELNWLAAQVEDLEELIKRQALIPPPPAPLQAQQQQMAGRVVGFLRREEAARARAEAASAERASLLRLQAWLGRSREVLRLWALLSEQELPALAATLPPELRAELRQLVFRKLVGGGAHLCGELIRCLIGSYLGDYATTDAIAERLRSLCPSLFTADDASAAKATELLQSARAMEAGPSRAAAITEALSLFKRVVSQLHLPTVSAQLAGVQCFDGIVDLALTAAGRLDPEGLATAFYRSSGEETSLQTPGGFPILGKKRDFGGDIAALYEARKSIYLAITEQLDRFLGSGAGIGDPRLGPADVEAATEAVIRQTLESPDELAHVAIFDWLIRRGFAKKLIHLSSPFLELYLQRRVDGLGEGGGGGMSDVLLDLLWEFYERQARFGEAAQLLQNLAERRSSSLNLEQRLRYLSRALACAKAAKRPDPTAVQELHDMIEVAQLQKSVLESLSGLLASGGDAQATRAKIRESLSRLNSQLLDVTDLYSDFAEHYGLPDAKLAILYCAGMGDPELIATVWTEIIDRELALCRGQDPHLRGQKLGSKLQALARRYASSPAFFPLGVLGEALERRALEAGLAPDWLPSLLLSVGVAFPDALDLLHSLYKSKSGRWNENREWLEHLLHSILALLGGLFDADSETLAHLTRQEKRLLSSRCLDVVATCQVELRIRPETQHTRRLRSGFDGAQMQLNRLAST